MILNKLNGEQFKELVLNGAKNLRQNVEEVDSLNVFPVPDGDTGTNMSRTIEGGINAVKDKDEKNLGLLGKDLSKGMLMGARGNSGVILSQIFRGICRGFEGKAEVNFVIQNRTGKIIPIEITIRTNSKAKSLSVFMKKNVVTQGFRITENNFQTKKDIRYIPIYAAFCLHNEK